MTLPLRQLEGKYEILHKIREGGMGAIYKVRHQLLDEIRVIKVIRPQFAGDRGLQQRFLHEARTAIQLRHPNIAQLYDFAIDEQDGSSYIVMEFIGGVTVEELLQRCGPPSPGLALDIAEQGLRALGYLHHRGYIHRDIAPDNLMLTRGFDGGPLVKLIDLGIVKRLDADAGLTQTGMFIGKLRYGSPEQFSGGPAGADHRSDLYSFGILLYELLTGVCPIRGQNLSELVAAHLFTPPLDFDTSDPGGRVAPELRRVVLRLLAKKPADRPGSAQELLAALAPFAGSAAEVRADLDRVLRRASGRRDEGADYTSSGSTQGRVDEQFAPVSTPRPEPILRQVETLKESVPAPPGVTELLAGARLLIRLEQHGKARQELKRVLEIDPGNSEARELLAAAQADRKTRLSRERRLRAERQARKEAELAAAEKAERKAREEAERAAEAAAAQIEQEEAAVPPRWDFVPILEPDSPTEPALPRPPAETAPLWRRPPVRWLAVAAALAGLVVVALAVIRSGGPQTVPSPAETAATADGPEAAAATGLLVLDALPWAEVRAITDQDGGDHPPGPAPYTPLVLDLPPGTYTLVLAHPGRDRPLEVEVEIRAAETVRRTVEMARIDPERVLGPSGSSPYEPR